MKNNNAMKLSFDDALLVTLFGTKDRKDTMERLRQVCTLSRMKNSGRKHLS